jgi:hypothetical protein
MSMQVDTSNVTWDNRYAVYKTVRDNSGRVATDYQYSDSMAVASSYLREGYAWLGGYAQSGKINVYRTAVAGQIRGIEVGLRGTPIEVDYRGHIAGLFVLGHEIQHTRQREGQSGKEFDANEFGYDLVRRCQATVPICQ